VGAPIEAFEYTFGIEEEFFLVHAGSRALADEVPPSMISACRRRLGAAVVPELLRSQVELVSPVFRDHAEAATHMARLRREVAEIAAAKSLRMVAAGTAPIASWAGQRESRQRRYRALMDEFGIVGRRNVLCGLHVHVAVPEGVDRVKLMARVMPSLPLFLALSTSSPFWNREATGLMSYRQAAYDEWPRTGIPDAFADEAEYAEFVRRLVAGGAARDASYLWWAIRPALRYPTLELRICDACTRLADSLALAALYRCLVRLHVRRPELGAPWTPFTRRLIDENRWRAKRFGLDATMLALDGGEPVTARAAIGALLDQLAEDAEALGAVDALARVRRILVEGTSAHVQLALYEAKRRRGESGAEALRFVVDWLAAESYGTVPAMLDERLLTSAGDAAVGARTAVLPAKEHLGQLN
jgi:carboxylate-amine ligase